MENVVQIVVQERRGNRYVCPAFTRECTKAVSSRYPHLIVTMASLTILAKECNFSSISTIHRVPKDQVHNPVEATVQGTPRHPLRLCSVQGLQGDGGHVP